MDDRLSRRGFARLTLVGAAALWSPGAGFPGAGFPGAARADVPPPLAGPSFALSALAFVGGGQLELLLRLRGLRGDAHVPADGLRLDARLEHGEESAALALAPKRPPLPMPRMGPVVTRRIYVPTDRAIRYGAYVARVEEVPRGATVRVRVHAVRFALATEADASVLAALDGLEATAPVRRRA